MTQDKTRNLISLLLIREIEFIIKNISIEKTSVPDDFPGEFYQIVKEEIMLILNKFLKKKGVGTIVQLNF